MRKFYTLFFIILTTVSLSAQDLMKVFEAQKRFEGVNQVIVSGEFCKVGVDKGDAVQVDAILNAGKQNDAYQVEMVQEGAILKVDVMIPASGWTSHAGSIIISVPNQVKVDVTTTSGYIDVVGVDESVLKAESASGKINVSDFKGEANLKSKSGAITAHNVTGKLTTYNKSGKQEVSHVEGDVVMGTYSGDLHAKHITGKVATESTDGAQTLLEITGDVKLKTNSGNLKLSNTKGNVNSVSASGSFKLFDVEGVLNLQSTKGEISGSRVKLTASSTFTTTEGKIKFNFDNDRSELSYVCESKNSFIALYGKSKKKKNKTGKGGIVVTATSTTGAQAFF
ncbi:MAG: DUF4097 family beta strand repeat protein [Marinilabiliaceae bacterium]|nr:DUF4097 family beta strand repeat protein [Marinilabiliaceae bacterium]